MAQEINPKLVELTKLLTGAWRVAGPDIQGRAEYQSAKEGHLLVAYVDFSVADSKIRIIQHITYDPNRDILVARYLDTTGDEACYTWVLQDRAIRISLGDHGSDTFFLARLNADKSQYVGRWHYPSSDDAPETSDIVYTRLGGHG